jgi:ferredoxin
MSCQVALTRISTNAKTGPIPVSTVEASTCPPTCEQFDTCYAKFGPLKIHWDKVNSGQRGISWESFCEKISRLPKNQLWRHAQAGDLPGNGKTIDHDALLQLVEANHGRRGFTYTHYPLGGMHNLLCVEEATRRGFTVNVSCDSLATADKMSDITDVPLVVVLPSTTTAHYLRTPAGRKVVVCPATYRDDMQCINCGICADASPDRAVIGFPAHGTKKRVIDIKLSKEN